jgi:hypothetical protein
MTLLLLGLLCFLALLLVLFFCLSVKPNYNKIQAIDEKELETESREDGEGDGLMLFDAPLFPPEFIEEEF